MRTGGLGVLGGSLEGGVAPRDAMVRAAASTRRAWMAMPSRAVAKMVLNTRVPGYATLLTP
jgi:hypothetical protein